MNENYIDVNNDHTAVKHFGLKISLVENNNETLLAVKFWDTIYSLLRLKGSKCRSSLRKHVTAKSQRVQKLTPTVFFVISSITTKNFETFLQQNCKHGCSYGVVFVCVS